MLSVAEARSRILALIPQTGTEHVPLQAAAGRVLTGPLYAQRTQPPFAASAMDGYAVRREDAQPGQTLTVIGESAAGQRFDGSLGQGQAVRIFTGAPVPEGADDILIQEDATRQGDTLRVHENRDQQRYIRPAGTDFSKGDGFPGLGPLTPRDIALLAAMNHGRVPVRRKPVVALIATGDELVLPGQSPGTDQIISSNNFGLAARIEAAGGSARLLPIARDDSAHLAAVFERAMQADLILTLGGASVGDHDLVAPTGRAMGLKLDFHKIAMRPGKPLMSGTIAGVPMIGLPGNPVSAMVCGEVFVIPAIQAFLGLPPDLPLRTAALAHDIPANGPREHYMRARLNDAAAMAVVDIFERQDSSLLGMLVQANALVLRPPNAPAAKKSEMVQVLPL